MLVNPIKLAKNTRYMNGLFMANFAFNGCHELWDRNDFDRSYFTIGATESTFIGDKEVAIDGLNSYGVCDSPAQFYTDFGKKLHEDPRPLVVMFTHVTKDPDNRGVGGGWRWHKWGEYVGHGTPTTEYLDDEDEFDSGIYCYHVYIVDNLEI